MSKGRWFEFVYDAMNRSWIDRGTAGGPYSARPAAIIERVARQRERLREGAAEAGPGARGQSIAR